MSCIVWNCRGLGNQLAVQELAEVVTAKAPAVVFLVETLADEARLDYVKDRIRFDKKFVVQRVHKGGGLVLYWKNDFLVDVVSSSLNHIDAIINKDTEVAWCFTGFYGEPETHKQHESWDFAACTTKIHCLGYAPGTSTRSLSKVRSLEDGQDHRDKCNSSVTYWMNVDL